MPETPDSSSAAQQQQLPFPDNMPEAVERWHIHHRRNKVNSMFEIDTSPPFGSVKEAVTHFENWVPLHLFHQPPPQQHRPVTNVGSMEEQALELEKDLALKEQETLHVLRELEMAKGMVHHLKFKLHGHLSPGSIPSTPETTPDEKFSTSGAASPSPNFNIPTQLKLAKLSLSRTTADLAAIRASVESLNEQILKDKISALGIHHERSASNSTGRMSPLWVGPNPDTAINEADAQGGGSPNLASISMELQQLNSAAEQFIRMAEASKCEVLRAMSEIEHTKVTMKAAEMRWVAARKMEEAAKAVEAVALAEMKCFSNGDSSLSVTHKARIAEQLPMKRKAGDSTIDGANASELTMLKEVGRATQEVEFSKQALEEALKRVQVASTAAGAMHAKETLGQQYWWRQDDGRRTQPMPNSSGSRVKNHSFSCFHDQEPRSPFGANGSNALNREWRPVLRPTISLGDVLGGKQMLPEDYVARKGQSEGLPDEREKVPLSEMLRQQSSVLPPASPAGDGGKHGIDGRKQFFAQRKRFGFIHFSPLPLMKQGRKKMQAALSPKSHKG